MMLRYDFNDLLKVYSDVGVTKGKVAYVTGNLGLLGPGIHQDKQKLIEAHYGALRELLGQEGTLVVPTHSFSLCNTSTPFSLTETKSEMGPLSEHARIQKGAVRQRHPFSSRTAIGKLAEKICGDCSRHSYGMFTPFSRMIDLDALFISVGMPPNETCSIVHQCEFSIGVPYRYTKEFIHPMISADGKIQFENFYHYVIYRDMNLVRDKNEKIFHNFKGKSRVNEERLGRGRIYSYSMRDFFASTTELLKDDPYAWTRMAPEIRPYQL